jgi:outer membrane protein OmpA-like peptidoglycan-associated protein
MKRYVAAVAVLSLLVSGCASEGSATGKRGMTNQTAFDTNSAAIKPGFYSTMDKVADVVIRYGKTTLTIVGHTDNKGTSEHNQKLSEERALSVAHYLGSKDVNPVRLATLGKGEGEPIASNDTESGRQANRRVEIYVEPVRAK